MKAKRFLNFGPIMMAALGALQTWGVRADTTLTFDTLPAGQNHNATIIQTFGDNASSSGPGVEVTGIGTPNIDLTWSAVSATSDVETRWDYYIEGPWAAGQLNRSQVGDHHDLTFTPSGGAAVIVKSLNFHGYYDATGERFTYDWAVLDAGSLNSLANGNITFLSDATKNHPVNINYTGSNGQGLVLRLTRVASSLGAGEVEGDQSDIAVDDIVFSQLLGSPGPTVASVAPSQGQTKVAPAFAYLATLVDGYSTQVATNTIQLELDGISLSPTVTQNGLTTTVSFQAGGLLRSGSTNTYTLTFADNGGPSVKYTNSVTCVVAPYTSYEWRFTQGDLGTAIGNGTMTYADAETGPLTSFGTTDGATLPHIGGVPTKYIHIPALANQPNGYFLTFNSSGPNGGGAYINQYSVVFDIYVPSPLDWLPFFNTDTANNNDADFYMAYDDSLGIAALGYSDINLGLANSWHRIAFVADLGSGMARYYVDGVPVFTRTGGSLLDGRFALASNADAGADLLLFNEGDTSGQYTHELYVSAIAFADRELTAAELAALGGPKPDGILAPSFTSPPGLGVEQSGNSLVVSWPGNYVGYALQRAASLTGDSWLPVPGVTNNSVELSIGSGSQFFRLVQ